MKVKDLAAKLALINPELDILSYDKKGRLIKPGEIILKIIANPGVRDLYIEGDHIILEDLVEIGFKL